MTAVLQNNYTFGSTFTPDAVISESYQRCGVDPSLITEWQELTAITSMNIMFSDWINKGLNLFTVQEGMLQIVPGQAYYNLPIEIVDLLELTAANVVRQLNGTPFSSAGGNAAYAFDGQSSTACTQTSPNGYISYNFGSNPQTISYTGIQANITTSYNLDIDYSFDNITWITCYNTGPTSFIAGQVLWFVPFVPVKAQFWRVRETAGNTLDIQEIYFDTPNYSRIMTRISRAQYASISNKIALGATSQYVVELDRKPPLTIYPTPDNTYTNLIFNYERHLQDIKLLTDSLPIPQRFFEAACSDLAARLANKFFIDKYQTLKQDADAAYIRAAMKDRERVPLRIQINPVSFT